MPRRRACCRSASRRLPAMSPIVVTPRYLQSIRREAVASTGGHTREAQDQAISECQSRARGTVCKISMRSASAWSITERCRGPGDLAPDLQGKGYPMYLIFMCPGGDDRLRNGDGTVSRISRAGITAVAFRIFHLRRHAPASGARGGRTVTVKASLGFPEQPKDRYPAVVVVHRSPAIVTPTRAMSRPNCARQASPH